MLAKKLKEGDTIGVCAPSKGLSENHKRYLQNLKNHLLDFKLVFSENLFKKDYFNISASPEEKILDINSLVSDKSVKLVWFFQGGDNSIQTLEGIDFEAIKKNPKIFLGKSDVDVLLLAINKMTGLVTFHGCDAKIGEGREFDFEYTQEWFRRRLMKGEKDISSTKKRICLREGTAEGKIVGCNLSSMMKLAGTKYFPDFENSILFIESYKGLVRTLLHQLTHLKLMGVFDKIRGLVIGHIHEYDDLGSGKSYEDVVMEIVKDYDFPVLKVNEFGHFQPHAFLPLGAKIRLDAKNKELVIVEDFLK